MKIPLAKCEGLINVRTRTPQHCSDFVLNCCLKSVFAKVNGKYQRSCSCLVTARTKRKVLLLGSLLRGKRRLCLQGDFSSQPLKEVEKASFTRRVPLGYSP